MKRFAAVCLLGFLTADGAATVSQFLFGAGVAPPSLSTTISIARKEQDRVEELLREVGGVALFLPVDAAWSGKPRAVDALMKEPEGNLRYDMLLAAAAALPAGVGHSFAGLQEYAEAQGGVVDSAYGTPYFVKDGGKRLCLAEWTAGNYVEGECASILGDPIPLSDAVVFMVDKLVISSELEESIEALVYRRM